MKRLLFSLLLLPGTAALAQDQAKPVAASTETAAAQKPAAPVKYAPEILLTMKNLSALLERGAEIPPSRMDALLPDLAAFNGKVKEALGKEILADIARKEKELDEKERSAAAKKALQTFRAGLRAYYSAKGGEYPRDPALLIPAQLPEVPELHLPGHERTAEVTIINSKKYDKDFSRAVDDTGGWLYFSDPESDNYGLLLLDCDHAETGGSEFFKY